MMPIDFEMFAIERVIIHEIPKRPPKARLKEQPDLDEPPRLSTAETQLDANQRRYLEDRIKTSLVTGAHAAKFIPAEPGEEGTVPTWVRRLLTSANPDLVGASHEMARALHAAEHGGTSEGLFVVALGKRKKDSVVAVIKLEKEEGVRLQRYEKGGEVSINLIIERELVLGEKTKVFKAGAFMADSVKAEELTGSAVQELQPEIWVSDEQTSRHTSKVVADFYLRKFLSCEPYRSPSIHTAEWFETVNRWANDEVEDPVRQTKYQQALLTELNSQKQSIKPSTFVHDMIEEEDRASLREALRAHDLYGPFQRDTALIEPKIKQMAWRFESGVRVLATQEQYKEVISLGKEGAKAKLTIVDRLKNIGAG